MPIFIYEAFDSEGTLHKGSKDAGSESEVRQYLRSKNLFPKEIRTSRFTQVKISRGEKTKKIKLPQLIIIWLIKLDTILRVYCLF